MNLRTKVALEESIIKWKHNYKARTVDELKFAANDCPLCALFRNGYGKDSCIQCPVKLSHYGNRGVHCKNTPYESIVEHVRETSNVYEEVVSSPLRALIKEEIEFLESLLPDKTT